MLFSFWVCSSLSNADFNFQGLENYEKIFVIPERLTPVMLFIMPNNQGMTSKIKMFLIILGLYVIR